MNISRTDLQAVFSGKRVLVTGHTGFKGSWLTLWLTNIGASVTGYALPPNTTPALFDLLSLKRDCTHVVGDIRDRQPLMDIVRAAAPHFIFHMAAQPLVRKSYEDPLGTIDTNIVGTANLLEAVRLAGTPAVVVAVSSDKCYENREWHYGYRENECVGGADIYSMSKGAMELVVSSYRRSFFEPARVDEHGVRLASVRAGNVVGGGDWAADRIVPDLMRAIGERQPLKVRNSGSVRPWQHVLEPLGGYLLLAARMATADDAEAFCGAWNFGPQNDGLKTVRDVVTTLLEEMGGGKWTDGSEESPLHEAKLLRLCIDKAVTQLGWAPRWDFRQTMAKTAEWYREYLSSEGLSVRELTLRQINEYMQKSEE